MKQLLVLLALVAVAHGLGNWRKGLKVRFDVGLLGAGRSFFIPIPETLQAARNSRWVEATRPEGQPRPDLILFTPSRDDVVIGALYDRYGDISGLQIAIPQDVSTGFPFDWRVQGYRPWTATNAAGTVRHYQTQLTLFVDPQASTTIYNTDRIYQGDYVYVTGHYGDMVAIPTTATGVSRTEPFKRQNCVVFMGRHYFYNTTATSPECTSNGFFPWFAMVDEGPDQLIGIGLLTFGQLPARQLKKDYFERPDESAARLIVNNGPTCFYDHVKRLGGVTMHIYFVDSPSLINCLGT